MRPTITLAGQAGYLFEGDRAGSYCFVPKHLVDIADNGGLRIDEADYFRSGWALRNMRGTPIEWAGNFLFPDPNRMVTDFSPAPISAFLARIDERSDHPFDPSVLAER
jgi:hypothetical protein